MKFIKTMQTKGIALITTMIIVAIASSLMVTFYKQDILLISQSEKFSLIQQSALYQLSVEQLALKILDLDKKNNSYDHLKEKWAKKMEFSIEGVKITGQLKEMHHKLNLNNINKYNPKAEEKKDFYYPVVKKLKQDFTNFNFLQSPQRLIYILKDWVDEDNEQLSFQEHIGAENASYLQQNYIYSIANRKLNNLKETGLLMFYNVPNHDGITPEDIVSKNFVVLPSYQTKININTLPCTSDLWELFLGNENISYKEDICIALTTEALEEKKEKENKATDEDFFYYKSVDEFFNKLKSLSQEALLENGTKLAWSDFLPKNWLSVSSQYFTLIVNYQFKNCHITWQSLLKRIKKTRILERKIKKSNCF